MQPQQLRSPYIKPHLVHRPFVVPRQFGGAPAPATVPPPAGPAMPGLPGFPSFSFFEIVIIIFIVWVAYELYMRYQKRKHKLKSKSTNLLDIIYDFVTDRREYYNENLDYL